MNIKEARAAIEAILASVDDDALPKFDEVEHRDGKVTVWYSGRGHILGSAKRDGVRDALVYRRSASWDAIEGEMACRADQLLLAHGDDPRGLRFPSKRRKAA